MSQDKQRPEATLPESLSNHFSAKARGQIECHVHLSSSTEGSMAGETHLILYQGRLQVFSRTSYSAPFSWVPLAPDTLPSMVERGGHRLLSLHASGGDELLLPVPEEQRGVVEELVVRMAAQAEDLEDAPTEVWEGGVGGPAPKKPSGPAKTSPKKKAPARREGEVVLNTEELHQRFRNHIQQESDLDAAFCVADALVFMGQAEEGVRAFHEHHQPKTLIRGQTPLGDEAWQRLVQHPGVDDQINLLMTLVGPVVATLNAHKPKAFGLSPKDRRELGSDLLLISRAFDFATTVLGARGADLYLQPDRPLGLLFANTVDVPSFVAGSDLLQGRHASELIFVVAHQLAFLRPAFAVCLLLPDALHLRQVVLAATKLMIPKLPVPKAEAGAVGTLSKALNKQLAPPAREQLRAVVNGLAGREGGVDLDDWFYKVHLSVDRAGLLLCQDLTRAAAVIKDAAPVPGAPAPLKRIQDLTLYALSKDYAAARKAVGLTVGG